MLLLFSGSCVSDSLRPHELQHTSLPCPSLSHWVCSTHVHWIDMSISSSVIPFYSWLQSFPASGSFPMNQFFTSGGQSMSFSFSISPSNEYSGLISFRIDWCDLLQSKGFSRVFSKHHSSKHQFKISPPVFCNIPLTSLSGSILVLTKHILYM